MRRRYGSLINIKPSASSWWSPNFFISQPFRPLLWLLQYYVEEEKLAQTE